jgi:tetratricopeptide (TPR) repeat protein
MKNLLLVFPLGFIFLSCAQKENIVDPNDYDPVMQSVINHPWSNPSDETLLFWKVRCEKNPFDLSAMQKLAALYANSFKHTGYIEELYLSDSLYKKVIDSSPFSHASCYQGLATNAVSRHEFWKAKEYAEAALRTGEKKSSTLLILTDVHLELGNLHSAKEILGSFRNKKSFAWLIRQSKVNDHEGHLDSAISIMEKARDVVRSNEELFCWATSNLADMYGHAGRVRDAYNSYLDVLDIRPDYHYALKGIAWIAFSHDHNTEEAKRIIDNLRGQKESPDYYLFLAEIEAYKNNADGEQKYLQLFRKHIENPLYGNMYNRHQITIASGKNLTSSIALARREIEVRPTAESYSFLAWALYRNGKVNEAIEICNEFVEGRTFEPEALYHIGMINRKHDPAKSKKFLDDALDCAFELGPVVTSEIEDASQEL